jgi:hypothetical protein
LLEVLSKPVGRRSALSDEVVRASLEDEDSLFGQRVSEAKVRLWLGDYERIAALPEISTDTLVHWEPGYPGFRNTPAFKTVLGRLGIPAYWREHGYPPQCRAVGKQDFTCD